jgi:tryptophanyl-tRNA synthetase
MRHTVHREDPHPAPHTLKQVVTPWDVEAGADGKIDYAKLIDAFGCSPIDAALVARIERVTGCKAHPFLRRGMFFAHRELDQVIAGFEVWGLKV